MKKAVFLLLLIGNLSSYAQSKRQLKFMALNVSYEDAKSAALVTIDEFLNADLNNVQLGTLLDKEYVSIVNNYEFNSATNKYKGDILFKHDGKNLIVYLKKFEYYNEELESYSLAIGLQHLGIIAQTRKKTIEYLKLVLNDEQRLEKGRALLKQIQNNPSSKNLSSTTKNIPSQNYTKRGVQFDINQERFYVGGSIDVIYSQTIDLKANNNIYIVESNAPKGKAIKYGYTLIHKILSKKSSGKETMKLPNAPGVYDIRYAINNYKEINKEIAYQTIRVEMPPTELALTKTNFVPGEEIRINWSTEIELSRLSVITIVPNDVPNGSKKENYKHSIAKEFITGKKGLATLKTPTQEGTYSIRLSDHKTDKELDSKTITVSNAAVELKLEKYAFKTGELIKVLYETSTASQNEAYIGILPSDIPHGNTSENKKHWIDSKNVTNKKEAVIYIKAPEKEGQYDIRMNYYGSRSYSEGHELASVSVKVISDGKPNDIDKSSFTYSSISNLSNLLNTGKSVLNEKVILDNINFKTGSVELTEKSKLSLKELVAFLNKYPSLKLEISGHTDSTGDKEKNITLSKQRAKAVVVFLIINNVNPTNLSYEGYGQSKPIADNKTEIGKLKNRRVEFEILNQ